MKMDNAGRRHYRQIQVRPIASAPIDLRQCRRECPRPT